MKIVSFNPSDAFNKAHRKENHFTDEYSVHCMENGVLMQLVIARIYQTNRSTYACVWLRGKHGVGTAQATGYGYHRASAALYYALLKAGVQFSEHWAGSGSSSMETALMLTAKKMKPRHKLHMHHAHA